MAKKFTNNEIKLSEIPNFEHVETKKLENSYLNIVVINEIIGFFIFAVILGILFYFVKFFNFSNYKIYYIVGFLIISALSFLYSLNSFRKKSYAFRDHDVIYKYGIFKESLVIVPYNRIQHIALHQGFFSRRYNLASLEFYTAGGSASDINIPGFRLEDARKLKEIVSKKIEKK
jgi:membrane protein YdbS with pleckstrin-like domain